MKVVEFIKRNRSTILTCIGAAGMIGTVVSAMKATQKAVALTNVEMIKKRDILRYEDVSEIPCEDTLLDPIVFKETIISYYIPTAVLGISTLVCFFGANTLSRKDQAALTSAYALLNQSFDQYRKKLIELHGEEIDDEVQNEVAREVFNFHTIDLDTPDRKMMFLEPITGDKILRYERDIIDAEYHFERNFVLRGEAPLNEWLCFLGIDPVPYGDKIGWTMDEGYGWIDFEHHLTTDSKGNQICEIVYPFEPDEGYIEAVGYFD